MSFVPCFRCLFRIFHLNFRVFRVLYWFLTLKALLWDLWELCKMCYLPSETPKKGPFFTFSNFFFTTGKTCFLIFAGGRLEIKPIYHDPIPGFAPFLSYSNNLPLGKNDQNGGIYIGKGPKS